VVSLNTIFPIITEQDAKLPFYLKGIGSQENQEHIVRDGGFSCYHWLYTITGCGKLVIEGNEYRLGENTGFLLAPNVPHEYYPVSQPWETRWLIFDGDAISDVLKIIGFRRYEIYNFPNHQYLDSIFNEIYVSLLSNSSIKSVECSSVIYRFIIALKKAAILSDDLDCKGQYYITSTIQYMQAHYNEDISLDDIASSVDISPYHLCRIFKDSLGMTVFQYLTLLRIQKAKQYLIENPSMLVKDIAIKIGYNDISYFCSIFKQYENITPMQFRKMHGIR
jgi:AraC family transcriptional regulator, arabinose operon regulatory protein